MMLTNEHKLTNLSTNERTNEQTNKHDGSQYLQAGGVEKLKKTRMVQLPATDAIEYVAACWVSGAGGIFVRGAYARPPKFNAYIRTV